VCECFERAVEFVLWG